MPGKLYIVATPIGNLDDISARASRTLAQVSLILSEDTRVTKKLLAHLKISTPTDSFHEFSNPQKIVQIINRLRGNESIALVTDAGTPAISDPGSFLVAEIIRQLGDEASIIPIPGACALTAALSISGFLADEFFFAGFLPPKKGRSTAIKRIAEIHETVVLYESPHRIIKTLKELAALMPSRRAMVVRELTKLYESVLRGTLSQLAASSEVREKGEFVIVLGPVK